jgi:predicted ester cyclase
LFAQTLTEVLEVNRGFMVTAVEHVEALPQLSFTVHVIVETPTLKSPLAFLPVPLRMVAPLIE